MSSPAPALRQANGGEKQPASLGLTIPQLPGVREINGNGDANGNSDQPAPLSIPKSARPLAPALKLPSMGGGAPAGGRPGLSLQVGGNAQRPGLSLQVGPKKPALSLNAKRKWKTSDLEDVKTNEYE
jgi:hypothetical protein